MNPARKVERSEATSENEVAICSSIWRYHLTCRTDQVDHGQFVQQLSPVQQRPVEQGGPDSNTPQRDQKELEFYSARILAQLLHALNVRENRKQAVDQGGDAIKKFSNIPGVNVVVLAPVNFTRRVAEVAFVVHPPAALEIRRDKNEDCCRATE